MGSYYYSRLTRSGFAFSRNIPPVDFKFPVSSVDPKGGIFNITLGDTPEYKGRFFPPLKIDISEWVDSVVPPLPDLKPDGSTIIYADDVETIGLEGRTMSLMSRYNEDKKGVECIVISGGLSKRFFMDLQDSETDIFTTRFLNPANNFFLTTRSASWQIVIKETELYPLYFILDEPRTIELRNLLDGYSRTFMLPVGIFALDLEAARESFSKVTPGIFPSMFDVFADGNFSCRIIIEMASPAKERYRLKYRSSFGVFELLELVGQLTIERKFEKSEDMEFRGYNRNYYERYRQRQPVTMTGNITTGPMRPEEIRRLTDAIASESVWLLDYEERPLRVFPSCEELSYQAVPDTPQSFSLSFLFVDEDRDISPEIRTGQEGRKPRVFSKQFNDVFN